MRLRSVTDVITNSSSEVFSMKASDYETIIRDHPELAVNGIMIYHNVSELSVAYQSRPNSWPFTKIPVRERYLLGDFKIPSSIRQILYDFGHTDQEILDYEKSKNLRVLEKREASDFLKNFIERAYGVWYDWYRDPAGLPELRKYLDENEIGYIWDRD